MIDPAYVKRMARYNRWQNQNLFGVADHLSDEERRRERGAFFGSIHKTLSHLMWADQLWMSRLTDVPAPEGGIPQSVSLYPDWEPQGMNALPSTTASSIGLTTWTKRHLQAT